jgi:hypothetical protein
MKTWFVVHQLYETKCKIRFAQILIRPIGIDY